MKGSLDQRSFSREIEGLGNEGSYYLILGWKESNFGTGLERIQVSMIQVFQAFLPGGLGDQPVRPTQPRLNEAIGMEVRRVPFRFLLISPKLMIVATWD